jgi:biopolymer transport protein ExbD
VGAMIALVFLFVPWTSDGHRSIPTDRPVVAHPTAQPGALREDSVQVTVIRDRKVFCNGQQVQVGDLPEVIKSSMQPSTEKKYVAADARAKYGDVKAVVEKIGLTGITEICFLVEKGEPCKFRR